MDKVKRTRRQNSRPTIGFLTNWISDEYANPLWIGVVDAARERDANLICFQGGILGTTQGFEDQANMLYGLVGAENVDGLVICGGPMTNFVGVEGYRNFCARYHPLPIVSVAVALEGVPSVLVDNYKGMYDAVTHLIEVHGYRRIAFIPGPKGNPEADLRYRAYADALREHGLPLDPALLSAGDFRHTSGATAIRLLLDERQVDFDAIVSANDTMALAALDELRTHGVRVPDDVAMTSFDDQEMVQYITPPLTTVHQPKYKLGKRAVEVSLALLAGESVPEQTTLPTELVVRQSCGCLSPTLVQAAAEPVASTGEPFEVVVVERREGILSEMVRAMETALADDVLEQAGRLLDAFSAEMQNGTSGVFLHTLNDILSQELAAGGDIAVWQGVLSVLRRHALPHLEKAEALARAENLWQQGRVLIGDVAVRAQAYRRVEAAQRVAILSAISQIVITTFDMADLLNVLTERLTHMGISGCHLSIYEGKEMPPQWSRLMLAYDERGRTELEAGGRRFPSRQLMPEELLPCERQYTMVAASLYFREDQLGLVLFEVGPREGTVYEELRAQLSGALKGVLILQERKQAEEALERHAAQLALLSEIGRKIATILDLESVLNTAAHLVQESFGYHHVGLFTVDRERGELVMRARAGQFAHLLPSDHRIKLGQGLVGWVGDYGARLLANDVSVESRYTNFYPDLIPTRSELGVPIRVGEETVGVLDVQSPQLNAFDQNDVMVMEILADQIAVTIENARLYGAVQRELAERRRAEDQLRRSSAELVQSNEELKRFTYIVSHDLRAPLVNLKGFAGELASSLQVIRPLFESLSPHLDEKQRSVVATAFQSDLPEALGFIDASVTRMEHFINALLALSRLGRRELNLERINMEALIQTTLETLAHQIEQRQVQVTVGVLPEVVADRTAMEQITGNVLNNAILYLDPGRSGEIEITGERNARETIFRIRDNGRGIAPEDMDKVFAPFRRAGKQDVPGEGMGLAYVQTLVRRHVGQIWCESEPGIGTTFTFTISHQFTQGDPHV